MSKRITIESESYVEAVLFYNDRVMQTLCVSDTKWVANPYDKIMYNTIVMKNLDELLSKFHRYFTPVLLQMYHGMMHDCESNITVALQSLNISYVPKKAYKVLRSKETGEVIKIGISSNDYREAIGEKFTNCQLVRNRYIGVEEIIPEPKKYFHKLKTISIMSLMNESTVVFYPEYSFKSYTDFLKDVVNNKETSTIDMTLYRAGDIKDIYKILRAAVKKGIDVNVNVEIEASGESRNNKNIIKKFKKAGINVSTYMRGILKVHAKVTLVSFCNGSYITQISTGNYNKSTAKLYTDISCYTNSSTVGIILEELFASMTNGIPLYTNEELCSLQADNDIVLLTQLNMRAALNKLIFEQIDKGSDGYICIKCNTIFDDEICKALIMAAKNGCKLDIVCRGACALTEIACMDNVNIISVVWERLEHSRVYCFGNVNPKIYIGSLDLVTHKIDSRIEIMVRVIGDRANDDMINYLNSYVSDTEHAYRMIDNGSYKKL